VCKSKPNPMLRCCLICSVCFLVGAASLLPPRIALAENPANEHVKVELISEEVAIVPHQQLRLGIRFDLEEGWHTYWVNSGDSGEAPRIEWTLPTGFKASSIQWPYPTRLSTPPFVDYGYEHQVLLPVVIRLPAGLREGATEKVSARVHYLVCRDVCIPGQKELVLELPVKDLATQSLNAPLFESTQRQLPKSIPQGWKISATSTGDEFRLRLRIGKAIASPQFFPLEPEQIENAAPQNVSAIPGGLDLHLKKSNHLLKQISRIKGVLVVAGTGYLVDVPVLQSPGQDSAQSGSAQSKQN
jgi:DsbC/DsbD-like thiol-disulfide interchange protein